MIQVLAGRWKLIAAIVLLAVLASAAYTYYTYVPRYRTTASLIVMIGGTLRDDQIHDVRLSRDFVKTIERFAQSRLVLDAVTERLGSGQAYEYLKENVEIEQYEETEIVEVSVTDTDPARARDTANTLADVLVEMLVSYLDVNNVRLVDAAENPVAPIPPRTRQNVVAAFGLSLMLGVGLVFMLDKLDNTMKTPEKVQELLEIPVLGAVPTFGNGGIKGKGGAGTNGNGMLITFDAPRSPVSEMYRAIRNNIEFTSLDSPARNLMVVSPAPDSGKSVTVANLGVMLAQAGHSVLLVDADLRRPNLHRQLHVLNDTGLTNLLVDQDMELLQVVKRTRVENLFVLPSGGLPPNPAELLKSQKMKNVAELLAETFDYVLYDTPPLGMVIDATSLAGVVDGAVVMLKYGKTTEKEALLAVEQLRMSKIPILGAVLNQVPASSQSYYYYYGGYGYGYGQGAKEERQAKKGRESRESRKNRKSKPRAGGAGGAGGARPGN